MIFIKIRIKVNRNLKTNILYKSHGNPWKNEFVTAHTSNYFQTDSFPLKNKDFTPNVFQDHSFSNLTEKLQK